MLSLYSGQVDNQSGKLLSGGGITLAASYLDNRLGKIFAWQDGDLALSGTADNRQGFIKANGTLTLRTDHLDNRQNRMVGRGVEADMLHLSSRTVDNQQGALRAARLLAADLQAALDNRGGLLSSGEQLDINVTGPKGLVVNNEGGEWVSQGALTAQMNQLDGVGRITADRLLSLTALVRLIQNGTIASNGDLTINAANGLINSGLITALRTLALTTADLNNTGNGEIQGQAVTLQAGQMSNTGLIDGGDSHIVTGSLHNTGTGRIYADTLRLDARQLINDKDTAQDKAATIAAREHLLIATDTLTNRDHALIYSDGDMAIGGQMTPDGSLSGLAQKVENLSADLEAMGALHLAARHIDNRDIHLLLSDEPVLISTSKEVDEFQFCNGQGDGACFGGDGKRYRLGPWEGRYRYAVDENGLRIPNVFLQKESNSERRLRFFIPGAVTKHFYEYKYTTRVWQTMVEQSDRATIRSGRDMTIEGEKLTNQDSRIIAGGDLGTRTGTIVNHETQGIQRTKQQGQTISHYKGGGNWHTRHTVYDYAGENSETALGLGLMRMESHAGQGTGHAVDPKHNAGAVIAADKVQRENAAGGSASSAGTASITLGELSNSDGLAAERSGGFIDIPLRAGDIIDVPVRPGGLVEASVQPDGLVDVPIRSGGLVEVPAPSDGLIDIPVRPGGGLVDTHAQSVGLTDAPDRPGAGLVEAPVQSGGQASDLVVRIVSPDIRVPDNSLFNLHPGSGSGYLVETDSRYTDAKKWISSQDIWGDRLQKRLGDGFYEQKMVRDQIAQATGQRFLTGMSDDNEQYKWLLNNGKTFAEQYQLKPGVALSAKQAALLTSDMVWMVNKTVTLPDGSSNVVSVPQLYVRVKAGDVTGNGALLAGNRVLLNTQGDITNSGTVKGRELTHISAENLSNEGFIQGNRVSILAKNDITSTSGKLMAGDSLMLSAGHDITSQTKTGIKGTEAWLDRTAGIYVENDQGKLILQAGNDIRLSASELVNRGKESMTRLTAGRDLTLDTRQLSHGTDYTRDDKHYDRTRQTTEAGSRIDVGGDLTLAAGRDIQVRAADIRAQDSVTMQAGRDINLTSGESTSEHEGRQQWTTKGFLSKTTHDFYGRTTQREAQSTAVSGDRVEMKAGHDLTVQGSNVVGTQDVALVAGNNLTLTTAGESMHDTQISRKKKSGLMGTGGIGFSIGSVSQKVSTDLDSNIKKGSTVGSSAGNVSLAAGHTALLHGSDVVAGQDLNITGREVNITAAQNSHTELTRTEEKTSGLTLALSGTAGSALNMATQQAKSALNEDDGRLAALKGIQAALNGISVVQAGGKDLITGNVKGNDNTVGVSLSYGSQSSASERKMVQETTAGSSLNSGRNIALRATEGDVVVQGSQLKAGRDTTLEASRDILLSSSTNSETVSGRNSSHGGSVGAGISMGSGDVGFSVSASVNGGRGKENGHTLTHSETTVESGNRVTLVSGQDTTLTGAQVSGNRLVADVGRNLTLTSEQDSERYDSKQQSVSAGGSFNFGLMTPSGSMSVSRDKMNSDYGSVKEQTGLFAGRDGFDVRVGEHTQLNGSVMGSTAQSDKNRLDTGTLGFSDIHNEADYKAEHQSAGISSGGDILGQFVGNVANSLLTGVNREGHASSTTKAAVSEGALTLRDKDKQQQDTAELSRDAAHANQTLSPIFDKEKEQRRLQEAQLLGEIGSQVSDIARTQGEINGLKAAKEKYPGLRADELKNTDVYRAEMQKSGTGSVLQQGIQAATAAIQGLAGGDIAKAIAGGASPYLAEVIHNATLDQKTHKVNTEANLMAHAVLGAVVATLNGNGALAGASGAVMGEYIAQQMYPGVAREDLTEEQRQTISTLGTLAAGLVGGVVGNSTADAVAGAQAGKNAVENNYLSQKQQAQKDKEIAECQTVACKAGAQAKWTAIDLGQDGSFAAGMIAGVPAGLYDTIDSIVKTASNPQETYDALKSLFNSGDVLGNVSDAVKQSYIDRIDRMEAEYQKAGASGSFNAGVEGGKLVTDIAGLLTGGAGVVKGGAVLTEKVVAKVVSKTGKAIPDIPPSAWKSGEGEFSPKPDKTVTNVEHPGGKYDGDSLPYKDTTGTVGNGKDYTDILSPEAKQHILYGDSPTSGGHIFPGNPGKTTFPSNWTAEKIVHEIGDIATSPSTQWYAQTGTGGLYTSKGDPAKWVAYEIRDGVRLRVVYQPATGKVITAFPDSKPIPAQSKPIKR